MTAEELALLGYQPGQTSSPDLNAAQSSVTPQDLQQFYAMSGNANIGTPDPAQLNQLPPSVDMATLNAVSQLPASDPNGFTTPQPNVVTGPDGNPMVLPPNANAGDQRIQGTETPGPQQMPAPAQTEQSQAPKLTPWQQYLNERGIGPDSVVDMASHRELLKGFNALQLKQLEMNDPVKKTELEIKKADLADRPIKNQNLRAQTAESQTKVVSGELAKQKALEDVTSQISALQDQKDQVMAVANHPDLQYVVGPIGHLLPGVTPAQRDLRARLEQLGGQQLLSGINKIKDEASTPGSGLGFRITQQEAMAVKNAVSRLQPTQDAETFKKSANEYAAVLDRAIAAKQAQLQRMPSVNQDLLREFSYTPASESNGTGLPSASTPSTGSAAKGAPQLRTVGGKTYQLNPATGGWRPIN